MNEGLGLNQGLGWQRLVGESLFLFVLLSWSYHFVFYVPEIVTLGAGIALILALVFARKLDRGQSAVLLITILMAMGLSLTGFRGSFAKMNLVWLPAHAALALFLLGFRGGQLAAKVAYCLFSAFVLASILVWRVSPNDILVGSSRNGLSEFVVAMVVLIAVIEVNQGTGLSLWPSVLGVVIAFFGVGRSGMAVSLGLLAVVLASRLTGRRRIPHEIRARGGPPSRRFVVALFLAVLFVILGVGALQSVGVVDIRETQFARQGFDTPRWDIWRGYLEGLQLLDIFLGKNLQQVDWMEKWNYNLHNSFLSGHASMGALFIVVFLAVASAWVSALRTSPYLSLLLLLFGLRAAFDKTLFFNMFDFIWMYTFGSMIRGAIVTGSRRSRAQTV